MLNLIAQRWRGEGGCGEVLRLALPLIVSTGAFSIQMFVDSVFLTWYSPDAMAAAMQGGATAFTFISLFFGTVIYVNTFVAQYTGAGRAERVGPAVWQGVYFSLLAAVLILGLVPLAGPIFDMIGHDSEIRLLEVSYFRIMCLGAFPLMVGSSLGGFFSGRGKTHIVMYVRVGATLVNVVLDYGMIFGRLGFPALGIAGAAWATVLSSIFATVVFLIIFFRRHHRLTFATLSGFRPEWDLFRRLLRYGFPNGIQFLLDMSAFTLFLTLVGRISKEAFSSTAVTFRINYLSFMPIIGLGIAVTILVGQAIGKNRPAQAQRACWSGFYVGFVYMLIVASGFWFFPKLFTGPFSVHTDIEQLIHNLLKFIAVCCLFDTGNIIFAAALKGAGDTRFVMFMSVAMHWLLLAVPSYVAFKLGWGVYTFWSFFTAFYCILAMAFLLRLLGGKWKSMRVIEVIYPAVPTSAAVNPSLETEAT